ncbi:MAG: restriction endonuclease subunit S [Bacteroidota bacterium]|nr:restriction endonuclease subunit S [Bacteroidota bacterium]
MNGKNKKGYKLTSLGWIPEEWEVKKIGDIGSITSGSTPLRKRHSDYFMNGDINWVKTTDLNNSKILNTEEKITKLALQQSSCRVLPIDTVLVAMYGGFNQIGRTGILKINSAINQALSAIYINKEIALPEYVLNWLNFKVRYWKRFAASSRKDPNITKVDVEYFPILIPKLVEQIKINSILYVWNEAIETTKKIIQQKEKQKKGLMQQLLTGKKRLKGFEEGLFCKLGAGEIFQNISVKGNENEELLSATQDKGIIPRSMLEARVTMPTGETSSFKLVEIGDFVISLRSFQGGLEYSYYRGVVSPAYTVLKPIKKISDKFYKFYFKSYDFIGHLATAVIGIRDGKQINYDDFCFVKIPYPSFEEQEAIANILQSADKEIQLLNSKLEKLKKQKKGLMQVLLTGKVRVKI